MSIERTGKGTSKGLAGLIVVIALALVQSQGQGQTPSPPRPTIVSMVQLIATPERFDGRLISVRGFLTLGREHDRLSAYEADAVHFLSNAVDVERTEKMNADAAFLNRKYVVIVGVFRQADKQQLHIGTITKITRCQFWSDPAKPISLRLKEIPGVEPDRP